MLWTVAALMLAFFVVTTIFRARFDAEWSTLTQLPWWLIAPVLAAIRRRPKIRHAAIDASAEGLRIGGELLPREKLATALLRREHEKTFVILRGRRAFGASVDVEVASDADADRLCRALALDAESTTAEFTLFRQTAEARRRTSLLFAMGLVASVAVLTAAVLVAFPHGAFPALVPLAPLVLVGLTLPLVYLNQHAKLRVGADGLAIREGLKSRVFVRHDEIDGVRASGASVVVARTSGGDLLYSTGGSDRDASHGAEWERRAQSIAWRIEKAREAYRAHASEAPQAALVLEQGGRTAREWHEQLRRVGAGAGATFRSAGLTREQLLSIVESTTAAATERVAAAAALRDGLTDEEKPRIRVAAERCAETAFGERMVRVAFAPSDEELESALEECASLSDRDGERAAS